MFLSPMKPVSQHYYWQYVLVQEPFSLSGLRTASLYKTRGHSSTTPYDLANNSNRSQTIWVTQLNSLEGMPAVKYLRRVEKEFSWELVFYLTTFLQVHVSDPPFPRSNQENLLNFLWKPPYSGMGGPCTRGMSFCLLRSSGNFSHMLTQLYQVLSLDATMTHCCKGVELQTIANSQNDFWGK